MYHYTNKLCLPQSSISNCFKKASLYAGKSIGDTVDDIMLKRCRLEDIPNISVVKKGDVWVSEDNRRLWVFKALESLGQCDKISVIVKTSINPKKSVIQKDITVRGDPGGIFYKYKIKYQMSIQNVRLALAMLGVDTK